jgi:hypothetical protein
MNTAVAVASLASAKAVASPAISPSDNFAAVAVAQLGRLELVLSALRDGVVAPGWSLDEAAAGRALQYFRSQAAGGADDDTEWAAANRFIVEHGISFDWLLAGDPVPMICAKASRSPRALELAKAADPIFAEIEAHRGADAAYTDAVSAADIRDRRRHYEARILIGHFRDGKGVAKVRKDGSHTYTWTPTRKKIPIYASDRTKISENVPRDLRGSARDTWIEQQNARLEKEKKRFAKARARTKLGKLEAIREKAYEIVSDRTWDLIWTMPTTAEGLVALFEYCRANGGISELARDDWQDVLEWTMECAVCALAGLPEPPKSNTVAELWNEAFVDASGDVSSAAAA